MKEISETLDKLLQKSRETARKNHLETGPVMNICIKQVLYIKVHFFHPVQ